MMSSVREEAGDDGTVIATRVGADMRNARERLGWELPAIAAHLRIRLPFLEALEQGRTRDLPGNAYAVGFLRTYAGALGLDPDEVARRFREEARHVNRKTELTFPAPVPERGVPAGAVVLLGVVLMIGAYAGWYRMSGNDRPDSEPVQPVPPRLMPLAEAPPPRPRAEPAKPAPASVAEAPPAPPQVSPVSAAAAPVPAAVPALPAPVSQAAAPVAPAPADGSRIVLRARADSWMQVRDRQGSVLLNRILRNGESWTVPPGKGPLMLTTGNAGGTEVLVDGAVTAPLGSDGAVRRDLPLDAELILDGKLAMAPSGRSAAKPQ
jgi:cytoskeleton protein RodZ